ncbi:hypothetical protein [Streptomyces sp. CMB-StM0423]|uniref:hypothetical protein n=1 Tax=Streptomyces sp. CMB-StM0423 TaxID=2059884 RepID=UPI001F433DD7|nr:hypothetical protein [Streptomyces sp. CMB-StM0423]
MLTHGRQVPEAAGPGEPAPAAAAEDATGGTADSSDQVTREAIRDPDRFDRLNRLEGARADRRRQEERDSTTQYIRRLHAVVLSCVLALIMVTGCVMLVIYSVGGLAIPGSRVLQTAVSVVGTALVTGVVFGAARKIQNVFTGSPGRTGEERTPADAP